MGTILHDLGQVPTGAWIMIGFLLALAYGIYDFAKYEVAAHEQMLEACGYKRKE